MKKISQETINGILATLSDTTIPVNLFKAIQNTFEKLEEIKVETKDSAISDA